MNHSPVLSRGQIILEDRDVFISRQKKMAGAEASAIAFIQLRVSK
jgi:hypothetical protein